MCSTPNVYMFVYILIGTYMVPLIRASNAHDMNNINTFNINVSYLFRTHHKYQLYTYIS